MGARDERIHVGTALSSTLFSDEDGSHVRSQVSNGKPIARTCVDNESFGLIRYNAALPVDPTSSPCMHIFGNVQRPSACHEMRRVYGGTLQEHGLASVQRYRDAVAVGKALCHCDARWKELALALRTFFVIYSIPIKE